MNILQSLTSWTCSSSKCTTASCQDSFPSSLRLVSSTPCYWLGASGVHTVRHGSFMTPPRGAACRPAWSRSSWIGFHWSHFAPSQSGTEPAGGEAGHSKNWCLASRLPAGSANPRSALFIQMSSAGVELVQLRCWTVLMQQTCVLVWKRYQMKTSWQIFPLGSFSNERKFIFSNNVLRFLLENGPNFFDDGCFQTTFPVLNKKFTKI